MPANAKGEKGRDLGRVVFEYANRFRLRAEKSGRGSQYPTIRQTARSLRLPQNAVLEAMTDAMSDDLPLDLAVGMQIGCGGGHFAYASEAEYQIETWDSEP